MVFLITSQSLRHIAAKQPANGARCFSCGKVAYNQKIKFNNNGEATREENSKTSKNNNNGSTKSSSGSRVGSGKTIKNISNPKRPKIDLSSEKKFSNFIREFNRNSPNSTIRTAATITNNATNAKSDSSVLMRNLPRVPSTSHLDLRKFRQDILYSGYRPLLLPIENDCKPLRFDKTGSLAFAQSGANAASASSPATALSNGNSLTGNGQDNNINNRPSYVVPNMWNNSAVGTEHFKEMDNIPYRVLMKLKPFQGPPMPTLNSRSNAGETEAESAGYFVEKPKNSKKGSKQVSWKEYFAKRGFKN